MLWIISGHITLYNIYNIQHMTIVLKDTVLTYHAFHDLVSLSPHELHCYSIWRAKSMKYVLVFTRDKQRSYEATTYIALSLPSYPVWHFQR